MTLFEQAARKRRALERLAQLKHNSDFDEPEGQKNGLLIAALVSMLAYGIGINFYYSTKYSAAQPGAILAKSEMTASEVKALNIIKSNPEQSRR